MVKGRLTRLTEFLSAVLDDDSVRPKRFSRRYHAGAGRGFDATTPPIGDAVSRDALVRLLGEMRRCQH